MSDGNLDYRAECDCPMCGQHSVLRCPKCSGTRFNKTGPGWMLKGWRIQCVIDGREPYPPFGTLECPSCRQEILVHKFVKLVPAVDAPANEAGRSGVATAPTTVNAAAMEQRAEPETGRLIVAADAVSPEPAVARTSQQQVATPPAALEQTADPPVTGDRGESLPHVLAEPKLTDQVLGLARLLEEVLQEMVSEAVVPEEKRGLGSLLEHVLRQSPSLLPSIAEQDLQWARKCRNELVHPTPGRLATTEGACRVARNALTLALLDLLPHVSGQRRCAALGLQSETSTEDS